MSGFGHPQDITYWIRGDNDGNNAITWNPAITIGARWVRKDGIATDEFGRDQKTTHVVYTTTLIPKRSMIFLGVVKDATPTEGSRTVLDTFENPSMTDEVKMVM